jgi:hypothetical protein
MRECRLAERRAQDWDEEDESQDTDDDLDPVSDPDEDEEVLDEGEGLEDDESLDESLDEADSTGEDDDESDEGDAPAAAGSGEEDDSDEASLDELLAKRSSKADPGDSDDDIMTFIGPPEDETIAEPLPTKAQPMRDRQEFVCKRCHLVKPRVQLADEARGLCRDCA